MKNRIIVWLNLLTLVLLFSCGDKISPNSNDAQDGDAANNGGKTDDNQVEKPLAIQFTNPKNHAHINESSLTIEGEVRFDQKEDLTFQIDDKKVDLDENLKFALEVNDIKEGPRKFIAKLLDGETAVAQEELNIVADFTAPHSDFVDFKKSIVLQKNDADPDVEYNMICSDNLYLADEVVVSSKDKVKIEFENPKDRTKGKVKSKYFDKDGVNIVSVETLDKVGNQAFETRSFMQGDLVEQLGGEEGWVNNAVLGQINEKSATLFLKKFTNDLTDQMELKKTLVGQELDIGIAKITITDFRYKELKVDLGFVENGLNVIVQMTEMEMDLKSNNFDTTLKSDQIDVLLKLKGGITNGYFDLVLTDKPYVQFKNLSLNWFPLNKTKDTVQKLLERELEKKIKQTLEETQKRKIEFNSELDILGKKVTLNAQVQKTTFHLNFVEVIFRTRGEAQARIDNEEPRFETNQRFNFIPPANSSILDYKLNQAAVSENLMHQLFFELWKYWGEDQKLISDEIKPALFAGVFKGITEQIEGDKAEIHLNPLLPVIIQFNHPVVQDNKKYPGTIGLGNLEIGIGGEKDGAEVVPVTLSIHGNLPLSLDVVDKKKIALGLESKNVFVEIEETKGIEGTEEEMEKKLKVLKSVLLNTAMASIPPININDFLKDDPNAPEIHLTISQTQENGFFKVDLEVIEKKSTP